VVLGAILHMLRKGCARDLHVDSIANCKIIP
jgi:hypothetical protein